MSIYEKRDRAKMKEIVGKVRHKEYFSSDKQIERGTYHLSRGNKEAQEGNYMGAVKEYSKAIELSLGKSGKLNFDRDTLYDLATDLTVPPEQRSRIFDEIKVTSPQYASSVLRRVRRLALRIKKDPDLKLGDDDKKYLRKLLVESAVLREKRYEGGKLEKTTTAVLAIAGFGAGIFFLSSNITGNAIADTATKTTSFLGAGLVIVGLVAGFFWLKNRK